MADVSDAEVALPLMLSGKRAESGSGSATDAVNAVSGRQQLHKRTANAKVHGSTLRAEVALPLMLCMPC
jgi:hypothetical protein